MVKSTQLWGFAAAAVFTFSDASADDIDHRLFSINGFGTVGAARSSERQADFTSTVFKPNGTGFTRRWSPDVDSRLGVQLSANVTENLSAVLQVVSEQRHDNTYTPTVEWANIKYGVTPDLAIRVGRIASPTFLAADYRKVGNAIPWVRPPLEVYNLSPVSNSDGADLTYRTAVGNVSHSIQIYLGQKDFVARDNVSGTARDAIGISDVFEYGQTSGRISYQRGQLTLGILEPFFDTFRQFGPRGTAIADRYSGNNKRYDLMSIGATYDPGAWFATTEWAKVITRSWLGNKTAWYVGGGYRFGQFTPFAIYSTIRSNSRTSDPGLSVASLPASAASTANALNNGLSSILGFSAIQHTVSVGARWDITKNVDLKVQYDRTAMADGSPGVLFNTQAGFEKGGQINVLSVTLDFVF